MWISQSFIVLIVGNSGGWVKQTIHTKAALRYYVQSHFKPKNTNPNNRHLSCVSQALFWMWHFDCSSKLIGISNSTTALEQWNTVFIDWRFWNCSLQTEPKTPSCTGHQWSEALLGSYCWVLIVVFFSLLSKSSTLFWNERCSLDFGKYSLSLRSYYTAGYSHDNSGVVGDIDHKQVTCQSVAEKHWNASFM